MLAVLVLRQGRRWTRSVDRIPYGARCHVCSSPYDVQRHHIDWDHHNNDPLNIVLLCQQCHSIIQSSGYQSREDIDSFRAEVAARDPERFGGAEAVRAVMTERQGTLF
jgi:5-methylcytosine-specific restriction endonuclease McrA